MFSEIRRKINNIIGKLGNIQKNTNTEVKKLLNSLMKNI